MERATAGIGLHVNAHKTEFMCFNQKGDISTLDETSLKLVDKFTYLGSSVSSTEKDKIVLIFEYCKKFCRVTEIKKKSIHAAVLHEREREQAE